MSEPAGVDLLAAAPLFAGLAGGDLTEIARIVRHRPVAAGDLLWRQGEAAAGMAVVVDGTVAVRLQLPGGRSVELAVMGAGETLGELPLVDGGPHSATAQAATAGSVLFVDRADFAAFVARDEPAAFALKRRLATVLAGRLRTRLERLAGALGPAAAALHDAGPPPLEPAPQPDPAYLERMAAFRAVDPGALQGILSAGRYVRGARGVTLEAEGDPATTLFLVVNGTVERVLDRGDRRIRVGLAGPGQAFGYEGLIDNRPAPSTAITRERVVLLAVAADAFARLFDGEDAASRCFLDVVNRDLAGWLRRANRPQAQLAVRPVVRA